MEVLQIDVGGKLAHFRKYYANNTAMSFSIPPRTTLMGMLAGMLGRPRDSYYDELASERIRIGVRVMQPIKKTFHRLNLLKIVGKGDFDGSNGRIQTPFEIVSGLSISRGLVVYRIYVAAHEGGNETFQALKQALLKREFQYALTFGTANFTASLLSATLITDAKLVDSNGWVLVHSAMPSDAVEQLDFDRQRTEDTLQSIEEELLPGDFVGNFDRELRRMDRVLFSTTASGVKVKLNKPYYALTQATETQHILFME
ncbi:CRISPR-associated protein Cas5 [Spirosoma luteum]|uniref:CRISPR-associated protein Cas5 n=1 Tax=Spirosoma luteum TaxID=431553 RepID=UPI000377E6B2|nr:CRISPR-associated protein Cas5 [Spirosoma luteum]